MLTEERKVQLRDHPDWVTNIEVQEMLEEIETLKGFQSEGIPSLGHMPEVERVIERRIVAGVQHIKERWKFFPPKTK